MHCYCVFFSTGRVNPCTAFVIKTSSKVLVGNNEDGQNPESRIWAIPGENGTYGRLYFGFSDLSPQGGFNEKGLWFDAFGLPYKEYSKNGEIYPGFDTTTFPEFYGKYLIISPEVMANQSVTIQKGSANCLYFRINDGAPFRVFPVAPSEFLPLSYGGFELGCKFERNDKNQVVAFELKNDVLRILARRKEIN